MSAARARFLAACALTAAAAGCAAQGPRPAAPPDPAQVPAPREYRVPFAATPPTLDGRLDDAVWAKAPWTEDFVDIEGPSKPAPAYRTRVRMLWDERFLYIGAELADPHVWGTLCTHDEIVFHDNDFEVFIDPDGDGREYYELEVNALGTVFDLFLQRTYRAGGPAIHAWDAKGLVTRIAVQGTLGDPRDIDAGWTVEWAIPWSALRPPRDAKIDALPADQRDFGDARRAGAAPAPGAVWRINFSRVQWRHNHEQLDAQGRRTGAAPPDAGAAPYAKRAGLPEDNWVWSPQWVVDMHLPQFWGRVRFEK